MTRLRQWFRLACLKTFKIGVDLAFVVVSRVLTVTTTRKLIYGLLAMRADALSAVRFATHCDLGRYATIKLCCSHVSS